MTEIREHGFSIDLPGEWEQAESDEPGALVYREVGSDDVVKVMLLSVRPMFTIADKTRLLTDYAQHRSTFETGKLASLVQYQPLLEERDDEVEVWWAGEDAASDYRQQHRALLSSNLLADACFGSVEADQGAFDARAETILATLVVTEV